MIIPHPRARRGGMTPNGPKVREALVHVIREADRADVRLTQFEVLKTLFLADRAHLNRYGRPITFDQYVAMQDGPVPSLAYDVLKEALGPLQEAGITEPLWRSEPAGGKKIHYFGATREASEDILSESDIEELTTAFELVRKWGYKATWEHVHKDRAYNEAWPKRGNAWQFPMEMSLLLDEPNKEVGDLIKFVSAHL